jgi:hypothetical protein
MNPKKDLKAKDAALHLHQHEAGRRAGVRGHVVQPDPDLFQVAVLGEYLLHVLGHAFPIRDFSR